MKRQILAIILAGLAAGCATTSGNNTAMNSEISQVQELARQNKISYAEATRRQKAIVQNYRQLDVYDESYWATVERVSVQYDQKRISREEAVLTIKEADALRKSRRSLAQIEKTLNVFPLSKEFHKATMTALIPPAAPSQ